MATLLQVEKFSATIAGGNSSVVVTLGTALTDTAKSFLYFGIRDNGARPGEAQVRGRIISATQCQFDRDETIGVVEIVGYVAEFSAGVTVDRGTISITSAAQTYDAALSNVTDLTKAHLTHSLQTAGGSYNLDDAACGFMFDNAGTLTARFVFNGTFGTTNRLDWQAIQYDACTVQRGSDTGMGSATASVPGTDNLTAVDTARTFANVSYRHGGGTTANIGQKLLRARFTSATRLTMDRSNTGLTIDDIRWEAIEFTDSVTVQEVLSSFLAADGQNDESIAAVSGLDKAVAISGVGQRCGRAAYSANDIPGEGWGTFDLTAVGNLQIKRASTNSTWDVAAFVIDFGASSGPSGIAASGLPSLSQVAQGAMQPAGSAASALPGATQAASGQEAIAGTATAVLRALVQSGTGTMRPEGVAASGLPRATQAGSGLEVFVGSAVSALGALSQSGVGNSVEGAAGAAASVLRSLSQSSVGVMLPNGVAASILAAATQAAQGVAGDITSSGASVLSAMSQVAQGLEVISGVAGASLPKVTQSGANVLAFPGTGQSVLNALRQAGVGTAQALVSGAGVSVLAALTQSGSVVMVVQGPAYSHIVIYDRAATQIEVYDLAATQITVYDKAC